MNTKWSPRRNHFNSTMVVPSKRAAPDADVAVMGSMMTWSRSWFCEFVKNDVISSHVNSQSDDIIYIISHLRDYLFTVTCRDKSILSNYLCSSPSDDSRRREGAHIDDTRHPRSRAKVSFFTMGVDYSRCWRKVASKGKIFFRFEFASQKNVTFFWKILLN